MLKNIQLFWKNIINIWSLLNIFKLKLYKLNITKIKNKK